MLDSPKSYPGVIPRSLSSILVSVAGLSLFLIIASRVLVSYPTSSTIYGYLLGADRSQEAAAFTFNPNATMVIIEDTRPSRNGRKGRGFKKPVFRSEGQSETGHMISSFSAGADEQKVAEDSVSQNSTDGIETLRHSSTTFFNDTRGDGPTLTDSFKPVSIGESLDAAGSSDGSERAGYGGCDLYHGKWVYDPAGHLYTNNTCPIITQMQNCQGNGRPDKEYEDWRWRPDQCNLPRFDGKKFLELMKGKTLAFIGDSVARNQMESLLCILWQAEVPKNRGNRHMQRWYFRSTSTMIVRIWSSWLVHQTDDPIDYAPKGVVKLHLDAPDENFMQFLPGFDVVVLSSGHWFAKQSVYVFNNKIVGGQLWWPDNSRPMQTNNIEAFGISTETILSAISLHPNFTGLTIVRSFSPDHYEGGAWNTGGSCTGKVKPATEVARNPFTDVMHEKQVRGYKEALKKVRKNGPRLELMDITRMFGYRHDGHPGPYRSPDPNKMTKPGPNGQPPPQDCLHWCMPGPVDTWNELMMEVIRRDIEGRSYYG